jgi:hypothetical protein
MVLRSTYMLHSILDMVREHRIMRLRWRDLPPPRADRRRGDAVCPGWQNTYAYQKRGGEMWAMKQAGMSGA